MTRLAPKRERTRSALLVAVQQLCLASPPTPLTVSAVAERAGVAQGPFYNHFDSLDSALDGVGFLLMAEHGRLVESVTAGVDDPITVFAHSTRQTLRIVTENPGYGRLLFDSGLPVDRLLGGLRYRLGLDLDEGIRRGRFRVDDADVTLSLVAGGVLGTALDLHRARLTASSIDLATEHLLMSLGVQPKAAAVASREPVEFLTPSALPLVGLAQIHAPHPTEMTG